MSAKKPDIEQIRKYLNGELDGQAMYQLERRAEADPLLWDMIKGMESAGKGQQVHLDELDKLIDQRVNKKEKRVIPLSIIMSVAAILLLVLAVGIRFFTRPTAKPSIALTQTRPNKPADKTKSEDLVVPVKPVQPIAKQPALANLNRNRIKKYTPAPAKAAPVNTLAAVSYKQDTVEYKASDYKVKQNATADELLKKMEGFEVGADGTVTHQGQQITRAKINGKTYSGADVKTATKNLPADIVDKIQVVDDYGDQANKTGVKEGSPNKILNIDTRANSIIAGTVVDKNNNPMANATITQNGTQNRVQTDANGNFRIVAPIKSDLTVNSLGYVPKQVKINDNNKLKITLSDSLKSLAEVNIIGYGTQKKQTVTGSVSTVKAKDLEDLQATTVDQALQGRLPGVAVTPTITGRVTDKNDHGGLPGVSIRIKGSQTRGTVTDADGKFSIPVPPKTEALVVQFIGYTSQEIKFQGQKNINIELSPASNALAEVMVTGAPANDNTDDSAHPKAGWDSYRQYLKDNAIMPDGTKGVVRLSFRVDKDGTINNVIVKKSVKPQMDQKAIDLVKNGPAWAGNQTGKPQVVSLRIRFR